VNLHVFLRIYYTDEKTVEMKGELRHGRLSERERERERDYGKVLRRI
jgi:hypothetical protein